MTEEVRKLASRLQAIEKIIGHLKSDHELDRCYLKGQTGDAIHTVSCSQQHQVADGLDPAKMHQAFFVPLFRPINTSLV